MCCALFLTECRRADHAQGCSKCFRIGTSIDHISTFIQEILIKQKIKINHEKRGEILPSIFIWALHFLFTTDVHI